MTLRRTLWALACATLASCGTVDVGTYALPQQGCSPPPAFFVSDVWPQYFARYTCGRSGCHDAVTGSASFRLRDVSMVSAPLSTAPPSTWPFEWQQNLTEVGQYLSCASPLGSPVLAIPAGTSTLAHPGGAVVADVPAAQTLFTTWLE
jgi:hypothetical protein